MALRSRGEQRISRVPRMQPIPARLWPEVRFRPVPSAQPEPKFRARHGLKCCSILQLRASIRFARLPHATNSTHRGDQQQLEPAWYSRMAATPAPPGLDAASVAKQSCFAWLHIRHGSQPVVEFTRSFASSVCGTSVRTYRAGQVVFIGPLQSHTGPARICSEVIGSQKSGMPQPASGAIKSRGVIRRQ